MNDTKTPVVDGLYVHIPFCFHKCHYCDFYSITRQTDERMNQFVDLVLREAALWQESESAAGRVVRPRTIFFGGGTPSLLPLDAMAKLIRGLRTRFELSAVNEFTVEVNPATADLSYCEMLRENGVDRLSFGGQSFDPLELKMLERHHDPADVPRSIDLARSAGFKRLNVDLIYAIPGQSAESWARSLSAVVDLGLSHISCYGLTYEPNTVMTVRRRLGHFVPTADDAELAMFKQARDTLAAAGYSRYEISNYAIVDGDQDERCRHNLMYWSGGNYIGLGPSAASHVNGLRTKNASHLGQWETAVGDGRRPTIEHEQLTGPQRAGECVMLALRLKEGVRWRDLERHLQTDPMQYYSPMTGRLVEHGLIVLDSVGIKLTEKGLDLADAVAGEFAAG